LHLEEQYSVEIEAVAPYSFELTLQKPAGWWWSTPDEKYENGICWTVTRFNGELCPPPKITDPVMAEAYSHQVISCGFWPGDRRFPAPAFYAYAVPKPEGLESAAVRPGGWNAQLGEFILTYDDARTAEQSEQAILDFCQSTYEAAANLANWDRAALECGK